jgi:hypothetical protein
MPKLSDIRRIIPEDVDNKSTPVEIVETISGSYNEFADEIYPYLCTLRVKCPSYTSHFV